MSENTLPFSSPPYRPTIPIRSFHANIPRDDVDELKTLLRQAVKRPPRETYENTTSKLNLGVTREWMIEMTKYWSERRRTEDEVNSFPNYIASIEHDGHRLEMHFLAMFSEKKDAVPIVLSHGWPGSFLEFVPMVRHLRSTYNPATLPAHIIIPSLIGFGFSSPPPVDQDFVTLDNAHVLDKLMRGLGFGSGYVAQGGDIGSVVSCLLGERFEACKAVHVNFLPMGKPDSIDPDRLDDFDRNCVRRMELARKWEFGYMNEQATKTATIGTVLDSHPIALLAWYGEKLRYCLPRHSPGEKITTSSPSLDLVLANITLYWLTQTASTSLYYYRSTHGRDVDRSKLFSSLMHKPVGYSLFPKEMLPTPIVWARTRVNLVWSRRHGSGGHFAAMEQPVELWQDVMDFVGVAWGRRGSSKL